MDSLPRTRSLRRLYSNSTDLPTRSTIPGSDGHHPSTTTTTVPGAMMSTAKRPGQSVDDPAAMAEFNSKKRVWVVDDKEGYLAGYVVKEEGDEYTVALVNDTMRTVKSYNTSKMNPPKFDKVEDIADLTFLNEASVVHNLRERYRSDMIYTYSGLFLVAVNPYRPLPIYTPQVVQQYKARRREENPPHVFAVAEAAWQNMVSEREGQSILITGESGAGKTENTKKVIQYLTAIAAESQTSLPPSGSLSSMEEAQPVVNTNGPSGALQGTSGTGAGGAKKLGKLENQILQANPILEAFGNAQTVRNNNSSRFGKFVRIEFSSSGAIAGANIDWYLLEKSRVTGRSEKERNFHVFYQLLKGATRELRERLLLTGNVEDYEYLKGGRSHVEGVDDLQEWHALKDALDIVGFSRDEQLDLFKVVAAILHIGNITVTSDRSGEARNLDNRQLEKVCQLLGLPIQQFSKALLQPQVKAGKEWVTQSRTRQQVVDEMGALCKTMYEKSFGALVDRINRALDRPSSKSTFIGVLDIAGFEIFEKNGFEQLCINYTNERLQQFFNHHMFVLEQEEYARESIEWNFVNFGLDLQPTIDLIEGSNPIGILSCLDEECIMPKATDVTFTEKLHKLTKSQDGVQGSKYTPAKFAKDGFTIQHYAGDVNYLTQGWLEKNKDPLSDNLTSVLAHSSDKYISTLFAEYGDDGAGGDKNGRRRAKRGAFRTVAQRHKEQLASLMSQLKSTQPHFVRCIVPNSEKRPGRVEVTLVLDQLRCNGVLEGIRIARLGYPNRLPFIEFRQRYEVLTPDIIPKGYMDGREACKRMMDVLSLDPAEFKVGLSKIFFKAGVLAELEERRDALLYDVYTRLQAACKRFTARRAMNKILNRAVAVRTIQRNARVYIELRSWPWWQLYTRVRPLLAATRNDEELRRKEAELALVRERAERDTVEKQRLEQLKMSLEAEKKRMEDELEGERALNVDKDQLLARSKEREAVLEEELAAMQVDLDTLESQLERALASQKADEERYAELKATFNEAADHLIRLEAEQTSAKEREVVLMDEMSEKSAEGERLVREKADLAAQIDELNRALSDKEEDLQRGQHRMQALVADLESKLADEVKGRDTTQSKVEGLEKESAQAKEQVAELARAVTDYEGLLKRKDADLLSLQNQLSAIARERDSSQKSSRELEMRVESLTKQTVEQRHDVQQSAAARAKVEQELDGLRALMEAKTSEDVQRSEVARLKEEELTQLRQEIAHLTAEIASTKARSSELDGKLRLELDAAKQDALSANAKLSDVSTRAESQAKELAQLRSNLFKVERTKTGLEAELQSAHARQVETDSALEAVRKQKDALERQMAASSQNLQSLEDAIVQAERDRDSWQRQVEQAKTQLRADADRRSQLEAAKAQLNKQLSQGETRIAELSKMVGDLRKDLTTTNMELHKARKLQNKSVVEHVHVLEEAKRYTDRQLALCEARNEDLLNQVRTLEKVRSRLVAEAEDTNRQIQRERIESRSKDKDTRGMEDRVQKAIAAAEREKRLREASEATIRQLQAELSRIKSSPEPTIQMANVGRSRTLPESPKLRSVTDNSALLNMKRQYESRISDLEAKVKDGDRAKDSIEQLRRRVEDRYDGLRDIIQHDTSRDENLRNRLLRELQVANQDLENEMAAKLNNMSKPAVVPFRSSGNLPPQPKVRPSSVNGINSVSSVRSKFLESESQDSARHFQELAQRHERANKSLKADISLLEVQRAASENVRLHLTRQIDAMSSMMHDDPNFSVADARRLLARDNEKLQELLAEERRARQEADEARLHGSQALQDLHCRITNRLDARYAEIDQDRKGLLDKQRAAQEDIDRQRQHISKLMQTNKVLMEENVDLRSRLEQQILERNEEAGEKRELMAELQELKMDMTSSNGLERAAAAYKDQANSFSDRLEAAEAACLAAQRSEAFAKRALEDAERSLQETRTERESAEVRARDAETALRDVESRIEDDSRDNAEMQHQVRRLQQDLDVERDRYSRDLAERDFTIETTRKKYQSELEQLANELKLRHEASDRLREESRNLRKDYDSLLRKYDDDVYEMTGWKQDKEHFETKIANINRAYEDALARQSEGQAQVVGLLSQVKDLRTALDESNADRTALQQAKQLLEDRLDEFGEEYLSTTQGKLSADRVLQALNMEKEDLRRALQEQQDRMSLALERQKKAEAFANDCQLQTDREREEALRIHKLNTTLEKQVKDLNVKIVDLETRSYASSPRPTTNDPRVQELQNQVELERRERNESLRQSRRVDRTVQDLQQRLNEQETRRAAMQEEMDRYLRQIQDFRNAFNEMQHNESEKEVAKRKAEKERDAEHELRLRAEKENETLKTRLESRIRSPVPVSSPARR